MRPVFALVSAAAWLAAACTTAPLGSSANAQSACGRGDASLAGHYYLQGVMEVGSEILLRPDGSFAFMLAYRANDQEGSGCWTQNGRIVALIPAGATTVSGRHTPDDYDFSGLLLQIDGAALVWDIGGSGYKGRYVKGR